MKARRSPGRTPTPFVLFVSFVFPLEDLAAAPVSQAIPPESSYSPRTP
jgi:hypothetical protein